MLDCSEIEICYFGENEMFPFQNGCCNLLIYLFIKAKIKGLGYHRLMWDIFCIKQHCKKLYKS